MWFSASVKSRQCEPGTTSRSSEGTRATCKWAVIPRSVSRGSGHSWIGADLTRSLCLRTARQVLHQVLHALVQRAEALPKERRGLRPHAGQVARVEEPRLVGVLVEARREALAGVSLLREVLLHSAQLCIPQGWLAGWPDGAVGVGLRP